MSFFSIFSHLLPTGDAFRLGTEKTLSKLFSGLSGLGNDVRTYVDLVFLDLFPESTRELREWERVYGLTPSPDATEEQRRLLLAAEWQSTGGQSPSYIEGVLRTAGYPIHIHEWWASTGPYVARDPRSYTEVPLIGSVQCSTSGNVCGDPNAQCDAFLSNIPGYFANLDLGPLGPPLIPSDSSTWPYFIYFGAETFPERLRLFASDEGDVKRLIQKLKPSQQWVVTLIDFIGHDYVLVDSSSYALTNSEGYLLLS